MPVLGQQGLPIAGAPEHLFFLAGGGGRWQPVTLSDLG